MVMPKDPIEREKTRIRMSEAAKKRVRTPEEKAAWIASSHTPEAREKNRQAKLKHFENPENRKITSEATKAAMARPEIKEKMHEVVQRQWDNPETRTTLMESFSKRWERPGEREKISETTKAAMKEVYKRPEFHEALSEAMYKRWNDDPAKLEEFYRARAKTHHRNKRTNIEIIVAEVLDSLGVVYEQQKQVGRYNIDFYIAGLNLALECDGEYWHSELKPGSLEKDAKKDAYLKQKGYTVLRLREKQILSGDLKSLEEALGITS